MHRCNCATKVLEGFLKDFAGISIRQRPAAAQRLFLQRRTFGTRPPLRQLSSVTAASPDDAFIPFDLDLRSTQAGVQSRTTPLPQQAALKPSEDKVEVLEEEDGSADWHAEIEFASPMVQAELNGEDGKPGPAAGSESKVEQVHVTAPTTGKAGHSDSDATTIGRSRAETRMLRKLKRVKDGVHNQSKPGKLQDQVESALKIIEGPDGSHVLEALVARKKEEKKASEVSAKKAYTARDKRTKRVVVNKGRALKGKRMDARERKAAVEVEKAESKAVVEGEELVVEKKKSRRERRLEPNTRETPSSDPNEDGPTKDAPPKMNTVDTKSNKEVAAKEAIPSEDLDDTPKPRQEPWGIQKSALERKFGETGWQPRKRLSPDTLEGIRALHASNPTVYNIDMLREHFRISPEAIRRVLKSKWKPNAEEIEKRMQRWEKRGVKKWSEMAAQGQKPPKKWRAMGVPNPKLHEKVRWEADPNENGDGRGALYDKAARLDASQSRRERENIPSLAGRIL